MNKELLDAKFYSEYQFAPTVLSSRSNSPMFVQRQHNTASTHLLRDKLITNPLSEIKSLEQIKSSPSGWTI